MRISTFIGLFILGFTFSQCSAPTQTMQDGPPGPLVSEVGRTLDTVEDQLLHYADSTNGNDHTALMRTGTWLQHQPNIQSAGVLDSSYLYFTLTSGLSGVYYLDEIDDSGFSINRGGPGGGGSLHQFETLANHNITNTNVLIFAPVFDEFYKAATFQSVLNIFSNSSLGLTVTVKKNSECTSDVVDQFGSYGLVILDTHGLPNGFLIGTELPDTFSSYAAGERVLVNVNLGKSGYDNLQAGQLMLARGLSLNPQKPGWPKQVKTSYRTPFHVVLTSNYVSKISSLSGSVIFANMCYGGQTQPATQGIPLAIEPAFAALHPISYYSYAHSDGSSALVSNDFAVAMEDSLLTQLITNTDSTGHCYLKSNGTEFDDNIRWPNGPKLYLKHFAANDYSYFRCGDTLMDTRDGQKYATVCIGKQKWMARNLNFNASGSTTYNNDAANGAIYGRLYPWSVAMQGAASSTASPSGVQGVCPKGWHIPSKQEVDQLVTFVGGSAVAGGKLKDTSALWFTTPPSPNVGATNSSGFTALPGGYNVGTSGQNLNFEGFFWTATDDPTNSGNAYDLVLYIGNAAAGVAGGNKTLSQSCRCVKDP